MKKFWIACIPLIMVAAGDASAQRSLTPGEWLSGLTESGADAIAAQARDAFPDTTIEMSYDIGRATWTVELRTYNGTSEAQ